MRYNAATLDRWRELKARELVAQQDVDNYAVASDTSQAAVVAAQANVDAFQTSVAAAQANVTANEANVRRLLDLQSFQTLRAPFAGIVTVRNVDQGTLISAGNTTATTPAFRLAQIDSLRIYVNVPQTFVPWIRPGLSTDILVREFPNRVFTADVFSTARGARSGIAHTPRRDPHAEPRRTPAARHVRGRDIQRDADQSAVPRPLHGAHHQIGSASRGARSA
jgi:multidrug resistance efflux pump